MPVSKTKDIHVGVCLLFYTMFPTQPFQYTFPFRFPIFAVLYKKNVPKSIFQLSIQSKTLYVIGFIIFYQIKCCI